MNQILINEKVIVTPDFKRKRKVYKFNFFLSIFLICTLFSCYIYAEYDRNKSEQISQEILVGLGEIDNNEVDNTTVSADNGILVVTLAEIDEETENAQSEDTTVVNVADVIQEGNGNQSQRPTIVESVAKDGTRYYTESILKIPCIGIEYPVLSETSDELLKISLNKFWGKNGPNEVGNYVIVGHNYKSGKMFGKLSSVSIGDEAILEDNSGRSITYKVYDIYTVDPEDTSCTSQHTDGKKEITLITCKNAGKQRLVVKAREVE